MYIFSRTKHKNNEPYFRAILQITMHTSYFFQLYLHYHPQTAVRVLIAQFVQVVVSIEVRGERSYRATTRNWSICLLVSGHSGSHSFSSNLDWSLSSGSPAEHAETRAYAQHKASILSSLLRTTSFPHHDPLRPITRVEEGERPKKSFYTYCI